MDLREQIARAICGNWIVGDDRPWQQWTEEADAVIEVLAKQETIYLFRRKGFRDFCSCDKERYEELAQKPMFECKIVYAMPLYLAAGVQPVVPDGWQLVPIEPIPQMLTAAINVEVYPDSPVGPGCLTFEEAKAIYQAMLAAAPKPGEPE